MGDLFDSLLKDVVGKLIRTMSWIDLFTAEDEFHLGFCSLVRVSDDDLDGDARYHFAEIPMVEFLEGEFNAIFRRSGHRVLHAVLVDFVDAREEVVILACDFKFERREALDKAFG